MNKQPLVLIVILNWNDAEQTISAVQSVFAMDYTNYRVLVIDNGSTDGSPALLRSIVSNQVELIEVPVNSGYTGGSNLGLKHALEIGAEYAWLLNNDTTADPQTLSSLVALAESNPRIGLVSPMLSTLGEPDKIVFAGAWWDAKTRTYVDTHRIDVARQWADEHPDSGVVFGTAMLVPARLIRKIGLLDDTFFAYYEDTDYSIRSLKAGFRNVVDWSSMVYHVNKSMENRPDEVKPHYWYYLARNERRLWRKHLGLLPSLRISWWTFNKFIVYRNRRPDDPIARAAILAGIWHGWRNKGGAYSPEMRAPWLFTVLANIYAWRPALRASKHQK